MSIDIASILWTIWTEKVTTFSPQKHYSLDAFNIELTTLFICGQTGKKRTKKKIWTKKCHQNQALSMGNKQERKEPRRRFDFLALTEGEDDAGEGR